jgi:hypothetical protein
MRGNVGSRVGVAPTAQLFGGQFVMSIKEKVITLMKYSPAIYDNTHIRRFTSELLRPTPLILHATVFVAAALIGVARYGQAVPSALTLAMSVWSIVLAIQGILYWRKRTDGDETSTPAEGVGKSIAIGASANAILWVMWALISDGQAASAWHVTIWIASITAIIVGLISGKHWLYERWSQEVMREGGAYAIQEKAKRGEAIGDDGEFEAVETLESIQRLQKR